MHESTIHQEASSSFCSARTSEQGPLYPTLRANPFPEVTDLFCRLPLPTLFYRPVCIMNNTFKRVSMLSFDILVFVMCFFCDCKACPQTTTAQCVIVYTLLCFVMPKQLDFIFDSIIRKYSFGRSVTNPLVFICSVRFQLSTTRCFRNYIFVVSVIRPLTWSFHMEADLHIYVVASHL